MADLLKKCCCNQCFRCGLCCFSDKSRAAITWALDPTIPAAEWWNNVPYSPLAEHWGALSAAIAATGLWNGVGAGCGRGWIEEAGGGASWSRSLPIPPEYENIVALGVCVNRECDNTGWGITLYAHSIYGTTGFELYVYVDVADAACCGVDETAVVVHWEAFNTVYGGSYSGGHSTLDFSVAVENNKCCFPPHTVWDSGTTYAVDVFVEWPAASGTVYKSKAAGNTNQEPPNTTWWTLTVAPVPCEHSADSCADAGDGTCPASP
jgi:hypothetical protein